MRISEHARLKSMAVALVSALAIVVVAGCDLFGGSSRRDAGPGVDAPDLSFPWRLGTVPRGPHRPGTWLTFPVDGITGSEAYLWVREEGYAIPFFSRRVVRPSAPPAPTVTEGDAGVPDDAGAADAAIDSVPRSDVFSMPLPILRAGVFHLAVGDARGPRTREVEVEVVLGEVPLSREEAASALVEGMTGLGDDLATLMRSDDPDWQAMLSEDGLEATADAFDAASGDLADVAAISGAEYMELPPDIEPGLREMLWNSGVLEVLATRASGVSMLTFGGGVDPFGTELLRSPLQGILFKLDVLSAVLAAIGIVCDVATIVLAVITLPAGGEGALIGMAPKVVTAIIRAIIDVFIPTDPTEMIDVQHTRLAYASENFMVVPWTLFTPQSSGSGSIARSFADVVLSVVGELIPGPVDEGLGAALRMAGTYILSNVPGIGLEEALGTTPPIILAALPLDMAYYNVTLTDVLGLLPLYQPLAVGLSYFWDTELVSPYEAFAGLSGAMALPNYETRGVRLSGLGYRTSEPTEQIAALVQLRAFGFNTEGPSGRGGVQIVQMPVPYTLDGTTSLISVQQGLDPRDRNAVLSDEDLIVLDVNLVGGGTTRAVRLSTTSTRAYVLTINDLAGGRPDTTLVDIYVGGRLEVGGLTIPDGGALPIPLMLAPGANDIRVHALRGHTIGCGPSSTDPVCLEIEVPQAANPDRTLRLIGAEGAERAFRVFTPPVVRRRRP